jgi:DNA-binding PadR family transcriptional regulator
MRVMTDESNQFWGWGYRRGHGWGGYKGPLKPEGFSGLFAAIGAPGRSRRFFESGQVRLAILSLLADGPKHGYEIIKEMEVRSGGLYRASAGTVYPTLQLLEDQGLIECEPGGSRKVYRLADEGRKELEREGPEVARIWERAANWEDWSKWLGPEAMTMMGPLGAVMKATFQAATRASEDGRMTDRVREILDKARRDLEDLGASGKAPKTP